MTTTPAQLESILTPLLTTAAYAPLDHLGWIRVTGSDRVRWLNGMVTNSIQSLKPGEGCYNFVLSNQGRIQADLTAFAQEDDLLLESDRARIPALIALFDKFIIMDDVELTPLEERTGLLIVGPEAQHLLAAIDLDPSPIQPLQQVQATWRASSVDLIQAHSPLVPRFELWSSPTTIALLIQALQSASATQATPEALDQLRMLEATPLYGIDIREKELPQETAQTRALHFAKGCYLGQEIVERIRSRGNVHRTFAAFTLTGDPPSVGAPITNAEAPDKPVGELTSIARVDLPAGPITLGLGYIRREALERNLKLYHPGGDAMPSPVPFPLQKTASE